MTIRRLNWPLWGGVLLACFAFISYPILFVRFEITRDVPWMNLLLFAVATELVIMGVRRAFGANSTRGKKIGGVIAAAVSLVSLGFFVLTFFVAGRQLPASQNAPKVGQKAPEFRLADTSGKSVSLNELLAQPINGKQPAGVLLIFYRGYW